MTRTTFFDELNFEPGPETNHAIDDVTVAEAVTTLLSAPDNSVFDEIRRNQHKPFAESRLKETCKLEFPNRRAIDNTSDSRTL